MRTNHKSENTVGAGAALAGASITGAKGNVSKGLSEARKHFSKTGWVPSSPTDSKSTSSKTVDANNKKDQSETTSIDTSFLKPTETTSETFGNSNGTSYGASQASSSLFDSDPLNTDYLNQAQKNFQNWNEMVEENAKKGNEFAYTPESIREDRERTQAQTRSAPSESVSRTDRVTNLLGGALDTLEGREVVNIGTDRADRELSQIKEKLNRGDRLTQEDVNKLEAIKDRAVEIDSIANASTNANREALWDYADALKVQANKVQEQARKEVDAHDYGYTRDPNMSGERSFNNKKAILASNGSDPIAKADAAKQLKEQLLTAHGQEARNYLNENSSTLEFYSSQAYREAAQASKDAETLTARARRDPTEENIRASNEARQRQIEAAERLRNYPVQPEGFDSEISRLSTAPEAVSRPAPRAPTRTETPTTSETTEPASETTTSETTEPGVTDLDTDYFNSHLGEMVQDNNFEEEQSPDEKIHDIKKKHGWLGNSKDENSTKGDKSNKSLKEDEGTETTDGTLDDLLEEGKTKFDGESYEAWESIVTMIAGKRGLEKALRVKGKVEDLVNNIKEGNIKESAKGILSLGGETALDLILLAATGTAGVIGGALKNTLMYAWKEMKASGFAPYTGSANDNKDRHSGMDAETIRMVDKYFGEDVTGTDNLTVSTSNTSATKEGDYNKGKTEETNDVVSDCTKKYIIAHPWILNAIKKW